MPDTKPAPRIVVWESDACAGVIHGRACVDCEGGDCEHECHHSEPAPEGRPQTPRDVPDEMVRIATEGLMGLEVRRVIVNIWPEIERQVRVQVAAEHVLITADDLAELLDYVVGDGDVRVVRNETLDRAFAALKATLEAAIARGEAR